MSEGEKTIISGPDNTLIASKGESSDFLSQEKYNGNSFEGGILPLSDKCARFRLPNFSPLQATAP